MKRIAIAADHAGYPLKVVLTKELQNSGYEVKDFGTHSSEPVDYPDVVKPVAESVRSGLYSEGILLCGSGVGACITANKYPGIRAALCHDTYSARQSREHDNANILCMGPRVIGEKLALEIMHVWLKARFSNEERYVRRVKKIEAIEKNFSK